MVCPYHPVGIPHVRAERVRPAVADAGQLMRVRPEEHAARDIADGVETRNRRALGVDNFGLRGNLQAVHRDETVALALVLAFSFLYFLGPWALCPLVAQRAGLSAMASFGIVSFVCNGYPWGPSRRAAA